MKNYSLDLLLVDWEKCIEGQSVDDCWNRFRVLFTGVLDIVSSLKEIRVKQNTEPWMTSEILNLIKNEIIFLYNTNSFLDLKITNIFVLKEIKFKER